MALYHLIITLVVGVISTYLCVTLLKPVASHVGLVDMPGGRKTHSNNVPLIGGIALFIGFCFTLLALDVSLRDYRGLLAGSAILVFIGVVDDFRELTANARLIGQILAGLCLLRWGHVTVSHLGNLFFLGGVNFGVASLFVTLLAVLAFVNAMNMIDGQDGLAGSVAFGEVILLILLSVQFGRLHDVYVLLVFLMVLFVFLYFNFPLPWKKRASIFLGDAGSTFIGFVIAWFAVVLSQEMLFSKYHPSTFNPTTVLWVLAYPLFDLISVISIRLRARKPLFSAARDHLHHQLSARGMSTMMATCLISGISLLLGCLGIVLACLHVPESWQVFSYFVILISYIIFCQYHYSQYANT